MKNKRLQVELDDLRERFGVPVDALTADEIAAMVDCCRRIDNPYSDMNADLISPGVDVRGTRFYPITIGAAIWLENYVAQWWPNDDRRYFWALAYACANANDPDAFMEVVTREEAERRIKRLGLRFVFSRKALQNALNKCLGSTDDTTEDRKASDEAIMDWSRLVVRLEAHSGIQRDDWIWKRTARYSVMAYDDIRRYAKEISNEKAERAKDDLDRALEALARLKRSIKARIEREREQEVAT